MYASHYLKYLTKISRVLRKIQSADTKLLSLAFFILFFLVLTVFFQPAHALQVGAPSFSHMQSAQLPVDTVVGAQLGPLPAAIYDEQLGTTFTAPSFQSLAYNVTAVQQSDNYGYGPGYLLNGLSNDGYWYQVGISYNWPYANGGYSQGFNFNYEVFDSGGNSVYPLDGGGGLAAFPGSIRSGDLVLLQLYFSGGAVYMYAKDWNTGASTYQTFANSRSTSFVGNAYGPSSNGFFTGLMTEWWHATPYSGDELQVTYSNYATPLTSAWLWMAEWAPSNLAWLGRWSYTSPVPVTFSNPNELQSISSHGTTVYADAYRFITGSLGSQTTTITLAPAGQSTALSSDNKFAVSSILGGQQQVSYAQNGTLTLTTDSGSNVVISGVSTGSSENEKWLFNDQGSNITISSGSNSTFYYYDVLNQQVAYSVYGGGSPANPVLTYVSAPSIAAAQSSLISSVATLQQSPQAVMVLKGTSASVNTPITGAAQEQWTAPIASWNISQANQISNTILYYHQYQITANYITADSSIPSNNLMLSGTQSGTSYQASLTSTNQTIWLDANTTWSTSNTAQTASGTERWISSSGNSGTVTGTIVVSPTYVHQYYLTVTSSYGNPAGSGWYNSGSTASANVASNTVSGESGIQYILSGWTGDASGSGTTSNSITMNSAKTATASWTTQYYLTVTSAYGSANPASGWFNAGSNINQAISSAITTTPDTRYVCGGWTGTGSVASSGNTSSTTFTINQPSSLNWQWKTQYYLNVSSNFGSISPGSLWADAGTTINLTATSPATQSGERYVWSGWSATNLGNSSAGNSTTILLSMNGPINATASWEHQYLVTIASLYGSPSPTTGWFNAGTQLTLSISSPIPESIISQQVSTGWNGTGSAPATGTRTSLNFAVNQASSVTWNWQSQLVMSTVLLVIGAPLALIAALLVYAIKFTQIFRKRKLPEASLSSQDEH